VVTRLYGEVGASLTSMALINFDVSCKVAIIRTSLETLDITRASIACITNVTDKAASVHILAISGTIKALLKQL
jgi:RNase P/RNase MRP subunit POP5